MPDLPQVIKVKRRLEEDPVDALFLEKDGQAQKRLRRATFYCFQRVSENRGSSNSPAINPKEQQGYRNRSVSNYIFPTAPAVGTSKPGDELCSVAERKATEYEHRQQQLQRILGLSAAKEEAQNALANQAEVAKHGLVVKPKTAPRRFHLTRSDLSTITTRQPSGIQKHRHYNRSKKEIATFIERAAGTAATKLKQNLRRVDGTGPETGESTGLDVPSQSQNRRTGTSMEDHPSTWDRDSDQLADELAAFALQLDPGTAHPENNRNVDPPTKRDDVEIVDHDMDMDQGMIEDTYYRVAIEQMERDHDGSMKNIGVLVIEEQDEELWETFIEDEEDSEWDEEDADSNAEDNPANDYPDEEVSSEDEYGYGSYKNRYRASDDEEYDIGDEDPWKHSEEDDL